MNNNLLRKQIDVPGFVDIKGAVGLTILIDIFIQILTSSMYQFDKFQCLFDLYFYYKER